MKLSEAVDLYIQRKRDAGMRFDSPRCRLRSFLRHCGDVDLHHVTTQQIMAFLDSPGSMPSGWSGRRGTLRTFFDYWTARGRLKSSPLPPSAPKVAQSFVPYIYSRSDLRSLLHAVPRCQRRSACVMSEATFHSLLLFLYATGMRLGEALRLRLTDVDLTLGMISIRDTKFYKSRLVPLGPDIEGLIRQYLQQPGRRNQPYRPLFQTKKGSPVPAQVAGTSFSRLRRIARIERRDDSYFQPRLHDLRHTFAVHRLTDEAFAKLPAGTVEDLLKPENKQKLVSIFTYHVVAGDVMAKDVVKLSEAKTVNGKELKIMIEGGKVMLGGAKVTKTDIKCSNGVIHVIDSVLLPQ